MRIAPFYEGNLFGEARLQSLGQLQDERDPSHNSSTGHEELPRLRFKAWPRPLQKVLRHMLLAEATDPTLSFSKI